MIKKSVLQKAAQENIIDSEQVELLFQFLKKQQADTLNEGDEPLKFVRSFGDVFITLGIILLVIAINLTSVSGYFYIIPVLGFVVLSEWLVRIRQLVLPGIALLLSILFFVNKLIPFGHDNAVIVGLAALSCTSLLFYLRYKMPFSLLPLATGLVLMPIVQIGLRAFDSPTIFISLGLIVFFIAIWFDAQDTKRNSHLSDNAFWLFLLASPLIVHGAMIFLLFSNNSLISVFNTEVLMIVFFACFFLISLLIDRRAMLVSTQIYIIYALTQLFQNKLGDSGNVLIYILIGLALFVIYFGTYWYKTRRLVYGFLSGSKVSQFVPSFEIQDVKR